MLTKRCVEIIKYLYQKNDYVVGKDLSLIFKVSDRTIRTDILRINEALNKEVIIANKRFGYKIDETFTLSMLGEDNLKHSIVEDRYLDILKSLLINNKSISIISLIEQYYISESTIENDIIKIRRLLNSYDGIELKRSRQYLSLESDEESKRKLYKGLLAVETKGNFLNLNQLHLTHKDLHLVYIKEIFENVIFENDYTIKHQDFHSIIIHLGIMISRIKHYKYLSLHNKEHSVLVTDEYNLAQIVFRRLEESLKIDIPKEEIYTFALLLLNKKGISLTKDESNIDFDYLTLQVITKVSNRFAINFVDNKDLYQNLNLHLSMLCKRVSNDIKTNNVLLGDIKRSYPLVFELALYASEIIKDITTYVIKEDEIGFIALHFGMAYDDMEDNHLLKAILILPYNESLSTLCKSKIETNFSDKLKIVKVLHMVDEKEILKYDFDLIITTVPIDISDLKVVDNIIEITTFVNQDDELLIFQFINKFIKRKNKLKFDVEISSLIKKEFFYSNIDFKSNYEAIEYMGNKLKNHEYVDQSFIEAVIKREEVSSTAFAQGIAVPHAFEKTKTKSAISIALLNNPITWGEYQVKLVVLFAVSQQDISLLRSFFDWIGSISKDSTKFNNLTKCKDHQEFIDCVLRNG